MNPLQRQLSATGESFLTEANQHRRLRVMLISTDEPMPFSSDAQAPEWLIEQSVMFRTVVDNDWGLNQDIKSATTVVQHKECGTLCRGDKLAVERFLQLANSAYGLLPMNFHIRPSLFPTDAPWISEDSGLQKWCEFMLIAGGNNFSYSGLLKNTARRYCISKPRCDLFRASYNAIQTLLVDDLASEIDLHLLKVSRIRATLSGPGAVLPEPQPLYRPKPQPTSANPYLTLKYVLHELYCLAIHARQGQDIRHHINPTTHPWDFAEIQARRSSAGYGIPFTTFDPILTEAKRKMRELSQVAVGNTNTPFDILNVCHYRLEERLQELASVLPQGKDAVIPRTENPFIPPTYPTTRARITAKGRRPKYDPIKDTEIKAAWERASSTVSKLEFCKDQPERNLTIKKLDQLLSRCRNRLNFRAK